MIPKARPEYIELLRQRGITKLFPPQQQAFSTGILDGASIVLAANTGAGKTVVAEAAMVNQILNKKKKALYLVPLKALANQKYQEFMQLSRLGISVGISTGDYDKVDPELENYDLIILTYERADSLLRHNPPWLEQVGIVVVDETHLLGTPDRGDIVEILLTKFRIKYNPQFICLSATLSNADEIAEWLGAELVESNWRPVPLKKGIYLDGEVTFNDHSTLSVPVYSKTKDDIVVELALDQIRNGGSVLIFCTSRAKAVRVAAKLAEEMGNELSPEEMEICEEAAKELEEEGHPLKKALAECIRRGVGFHHAGLDFQSRLTVERLFDQLAIKAVCATPTLSMGINTFARTVIFHEVNRYEPKIGKSVPISVLEWYQASGRAGRPGKAESCGYSIIVANDQQQFDKYWDRYILGEPEPIQSQLASVPKLRFHTLALIASGYANDVDQLREFFSQSFCSYQLGADAIANRIVEVLSWLHEHQFIRIDGTQLSPTKFGSTVSKLYIDPLTALILKVCFYRIQNDDQALGVIGCVPDMPEVLCEPKESLCMELGSQLGFLKEYPDIYAKGVKNGVILRDWIEEHTEAELMYDHAIQPGDLRVLTETAQWIAYSGAVLARLLGYKSQSQMFSTLEQRIKYGVKQELLELVEIPRVGRVRARILYDAGFRDLQSIANSSVKQLSELKLIGERLAESILEWCKKKLENDQKV